MAHSSTPHPSIYNDVHGDQINYTIVFNQVQTLSQRLTAIETKLQPESQQELTDVSYQLADIVASVVSDHGQIHPAILRDEIHRQIERAADIDDRINNAEGREIASSDANSMASVLSWDSISHYFEDENADKDMVSSFQRLVHGPLAQPRHPYPTSHRTESSFSVEVAHPPLRKPKPILLSSQSDYRNSHHAPSGTALRQQGLTAAGLLLTLRSRLRTETVHQEANEAFIRSNLSSNDGKYEEAMKAIDECIVLYGALAKARPKEYQNYPAGLSKNRSEILSKLGRHEEALKAMEEAVTLYREQAKVDPKSNNNNLAAVLHFFSVQLLSLGQREKALKTIDEAIVMYRELARARPEYDSVVNRLLVHRGNCLSALGMLDEALKSSEEAVIKNRELVRARPETYNGDLARSLHTLSIRLSDLGRDQEALKVIEEAVAIRRDLARAHPEAEFDGDLADSQNIRSKLQADIANQGPGLS